MVAIEPHSSLFDLQIHNSEREKNSKIDTFEWSTNA